MKTILPYNSTQLEIDVERIHTYIESLPVDLILDVWNADTCPEKFLPWLAWALSVDEWETSWSEQKKREVIRESVYIHRHKGTRAAVKRALKLANAEDVELIEWFDEGGSGVPKTFWLTIPEHHAVLVVDGQKRLLAFVNSAKPISVHLQAIILAYAEIQLNEGYFSMPSTVRYDDHHPFFIKEHGTILVQEFNISLGGVFEQEALRPSSFPMDERWFSIDLLLLNQNLTRFEKPISKIIHPKPEGEIEEGLIKVNAQISSQLDLATYLHQVKQERPLDLFISTNQSIYAKAYALNTSLRVTKKALANIIQHIVGPTLPGQLIVNKSILEKLFSQSIGTLQQTENSLYNYCFSPVYTVEESFITNHLFSPKEKNVLGVIKKLVFDGEVEYGVLKTERHIFDLETSQTFSRSKVFEVGNITTSKVFHTEIMENLSQCQQEICFDSWLLNTASRFYHYSVNYFNSLSPNPFLNVIQKVNRLEGEVKPGRVEYQSSLKSELFSVVFSNLGGSTTHSSSSYEVSSGCFIAELINCYDLSDDEDQVSVKEYEQISLLSHLNNQSPEYFFLENFEQSFLVGLLTNQQCHIPILKTNSILHPIDDDNEIEIGHVKNYAAANDSLDTNCFLRAKEKRRWGFEECSPIPSKTLMSFTVAYAQ